MDILIYGVGSLAEYAEYVISIDSPYKVGGFCFENAESNTKEINGLKLFNFNTIEKEYPPEKYQLFIAIGLNKERKRIFDLAKEKGYKMISYISSKANTWPDLVHGENTWISEGSSISAFTTLGENCIILGASLGHHVTVGHNCLLSASSIGGKVDIGDFSFLGINSSIQQNVKIGQNNIIGMGCVIHKNTGINEIYDASKSTKLRTLSADQFEKKYLK